MNLFASVGEKMARWRRAEEKAVAVEVLRKSKKDKSKKAWAEKNPDRISSYAEKNTSKYRNDPEHRAKVRAYNKEKKAAIPDWYARQLLRMVTAPPDDLVKVKRLHLLIKKALRRIEDEKH